MKASGIHEMSNDELRERLEEKMKALRNFRILLVTSSIDDVRAVRTARRDVARIKTVLRERELGIRHANKKKAS